MTEEKKAAKEESIDPSLTRKAKDNPDFLIELVQQIEEKSISASRMAQGKRKNIYITSESLINN